MQKNNPFNTEVEEYEEWFKTNDKLLESELDAIRQLLPTSGEGIEIGVGTGIFASKLHESYQFALMVTVDCFVNDILKAFSEVRRILVNNGIFIIAFLDKATPLGELYEQNKHWHKSYKDANFHSAEEIHKLLEEAGFEILKTKQTVYALENNLQEIKSGTGEGLFVVINAQKRY